ncbi:NAD(P)/FAD-dependent oxidoreductase [Streptomyces sp. Lzd4kr]|nr:NAD(P)/FAD-dependent oxidoreductase [Streptomyces sp. Lzd4kr]
MAQNTDVVVIGMGPGGEHLAGRLAEAGLHVTGIEAELVGGECPYWGCVPSKMMIRAGNLLADARRIPAMAGKVQIEPDWRRVASRIRAEATDNWDDRVAADRFIRKGGHLVRGRGRLAGWNRVEVNGEIYVASRGVVIATGSCPDIPPLTGIEDVPYWTNRDAVFAKEVPRSLIVVGGGAVGLEFAQAFARFGTQVTVVEGGQRLLPMEEPEAGELIAGVLRTDGVNICTGARATALKNHSDAITVELESGEQHSAEHLLVATGRRVDLASLGVDTVGLDPTATSLKVDENMQAAPGLWGVGDVTGQGAFTHIAMYQAEIAVRAVLGEEGPCADYRAVPSVTFTDPEIASVGLTETRARERGLRVRTGLARVPDSSRGWIHNAGNQGFVKVVADVDRGVLIGATAAGPAGGEVLYGLSVAVQAQVPVEDLRHMIYAYPTFHGGVAEALAQLENGT